MAVRDFLDRFFFVFELTIDAALVEKWLKIYEEVPAESRPEYNERLIESVFVLQDNSDLRLTAVH
jgi:hypothetical protein